MEKKSFTVIHGPILDPHIVTITLDGIWTSDRLTPKLAVRAARVGAGHRSQVTVWSNDDHGYRLYAQTARKIWKEE